MRVAARPSSDIVVDGAARFRHRTAGDLGRFLRLRGDLADRAGKLLSRAGGRRHVLRRRADPLLGRARFGRDRIGGTVECRVPSSRAVAMHRATWRAPRRSTARTARSLRAICSLRCSRARLASSWVAASRSRSTALSRNTMTVRAMRPISSFASVSGIATDVSPSARFSIARARPVSGRVMLRPINKLSSRPSPTTPKPMATMIVRACVPAKPSRPRCLRLTLCRRRDDPIGYRKHLTGLDLMTARSGPGLSVLAIHSPNVSA